MLRISLKALLVSWATCGAAFAQGPAPVAGEDEFDLEDVFGFTEGTDVKSPGELTVEAGAEGRFGKGDGRFKASPTSVTINYGLIERLEIGASLDGAGYDIENLSGTEDRSRFVFDGLEGEAKLALVDRGEESPIGLSAVADIDWTRTDDGTGLQSDALGGSLTLLADTHLLPETLFLAANLGLDAERDLDARETNSSAFASLAASLRVARNSTLGIDTRIEGAFDGVLEKRTGTAAFAGPTFYTDIGERLSIQGGWLAQIAGSGGRFNTEDFERHRVTAAIEIAF